MFLSPADLSIRHFIYQYFVNETRPPSPAETAQAFGLTEEDARAAYQRLHDHHFFFLDPGTTTIRLANPFSAIPTDFTVRVNGKSYWANCAWDMLGIPAMQHQDASISARVEGSEERIEIMVKNGQLQTVPGVVHFLLPFRQWYDDLIHT
jgi:hypothetical protein